MSMKNYDERIESIFRKYNEKLEAKKRKTAVIRRTVFSAAGMCAAVVIAVGVWHIPSIQTPSNSELYSGNDSVIAATTDNSGDNYGPAVTTSATTTICQPENIPPKENSTTTSAGTTIYQTETTYTRTTMTDDYIVQENTNTSEVTTSTLTTSNTVTPVAPNDTPDNTNYYYRFKLDDSDTEFTKETGTLSTSVIGDLIGTQKLIDNTENGKISCNADLYSIRDISSEAMIAVRYEGKEDFTLYRNHDFIPETLGDFIDDLGLEEYAFFNSAEYYDFSDSFRLCNYYGFDTELIFEYLIDNADAQCFKYGELSPVQVNASMNIICDMYDIVSLRIGFGISKKGYITTNLTGGGLAFYIGEDKTAEIINFITVNYPYSVLSDNNNGTEIETNYISETK